MTFEAFESGQRAGRKVFLYVWQRGDKVWRYTSADETISINAQTYKPAAMRHPQIEQGQEIVRMNVEVEVPYNNEVALMYRVQSPVDSVVLTISSTYIEDPDSEIRAQWQGRIIGVSWDMTDGVATITHAPTFTSLQRTGLRRRCQSTCPLVLYGRLCGVSRETYKLATTVVDIAGFAVTVEGASAFPAGYFDGGYVEYLVENGVTERRGIRSHAAGVLNMQGNPIGLKAGMGLNVYPGCDHTLGVNGCEKFSNIPNYGGFPFFPKKNPFGSSPVY